MFLVFLRERQAALAILLRLASTLAVRTSRVHSLLLVRYARYIFAHLLVSCPTVLVKTSSKGTLGKHKAQVICFVSSFLLFRCYTILYTKCYMLYTIMCVYIYIYIYAMYCILYTIYYMQLAFFRKAQAICFVSYFIVRLLSFGRRRIYIHLTIS